MISSVCALRRPGRKDEAHGKQVSRAESWRYESNIYIKPSVNKVIPFHFNFEKNIKCLFKASAKHFCQSTISADATFLLQQEVQTSRKSQLITADEEEARDALDEGGGYSEDNSANHPRASQQRSAREE